LLLPKRITNQVFQYCLAVAAQQTGVHIHAVCVLSNHYHLALTDPEARKPEFVEILNKYVAKCMNTHYGRVENFFAGSVQPSYVDLATPVAMLDKLLYIVCNPVEAGLVRRSVDWPGVCLWRPGTYKTRRPSVFFSKTGEMPKSVPLEIRPISYPGVNNHREYIELVGQAIALRETKIRSRRKLAKKTFLGAKTVLAQAPTDSPDSPRSRRRISPRVATRNKWRCIEVLQRLEAFGSDHSRCFETWRSGDRQVAFPAGTYQMRIHHSVAHLGLEYVHN